MLSVAAIRRTSSLIVGHSPAVTQKEEKKIKKGQLVYGYILHRQQRRLLTRSTAFYLFIFLFFFPIYSFFHYF